MSRNHRHRKKAKATSPVSQDATPGNPMLPEQRINRAVAVATGQIGVKIAAATERRTGRPRIIPIAGVLAAYIFHATGQPHAMTIAGVCRTLKELTPAQRTGSVSPDRSRSGTSGSAPACTRSCA